MRDLLCSFYIVATTQDVLVEIETLLILHDVSYHTSGMVVTLAGRINPAVFHQLRIAFRAMSSDLLKFKMTVDEEVAQ